MSDWGGLDRIRLTGLRARGHHGVLAFERDGGQWFVVDLEVGLDLQAAALRDDLAATVNYAELAERVHAIVGGDPVDLIESLALRIVNMCWDYPAVHRVRVTVHKPQAPIEVAFDDVAVTIERSRQ